MHKKNIMNLGPAPGKSDKALVMLHGRGASASDISGLSRVLNVDGFSIVVPEATNNTWYPYSFLAPVKQNEPWLSSALDLLSDIVTGLNASGVPSEKIYFTGFSQGACLTLEFVSRNARKWGGVAAFTGGLIGETLDKANYAGDFHGTPVFIGTSDPDPHVPLARVGESVAVMKALKADVNLSVFPGMGHTITQEEIELANKLVFR